MKRFWSSLVAAALVVGVAHAEPVMEVPYKANGYGTLPSDKFIVDHILDPKVEGVACWYSRPRLGGVTGTIGAANDPTELSLDCQKISPIQFKDKIGVNEIVFKESRNWNGIKTVQIVRNCDAKLNALIYLVFSDYILDGSPKHNMRVVPLGNNVSCKDFKR